LLLSTTDGVAMARANGLLKLFGEVPIKAVSFDITGTLLVHKYPIMETYARCAVETRLCSAPPSAIDFKPAFKQAYKETLLAYPCFGGNVKSDRDWWYLTVRRAVELTGKKVTQRDFDRYFRAVYQHYGSPEGYEILDDTLPLLKFLGEKSVAAGVTTNTPYRTLDTVLPMLGLSKFFNFFSCCQEVGHEKPQAEIFAETFEQIRFQLGPNSELKKSEVLHIGDSLCADYCGAKAFGFTALFLDRSANSKVTTYQDWLDAPSYPGQSQQDISKHTVTTLLQVRSLLH